jgi:hypothetical protein
MAADIHWANSVSTVIDILWWIYGYKEECWAVRESQKKPAHYAQEEDRLSSSEWKEMEWLAKETFRYKAGSNGLEILLKFKVQYICS